MGSRSMTWLRVSLSHLESMGAWMRSEFGLLPLLFGKNQKQLSVLLFCCPPFT